MNTSSQSRMHPILWTSVEDRLTSLLTLAHLEFGYVAQWDPSTHADHVELDAQDDARQSTPERNLRGAVTFHLRFTLGPFSLHFLFGSLTTAGCLLLVCILIHCTVSTHVSEGACHALWASRCDLRDPGWGDPGFPHRWFCSLFCTFIAILQ